MRETHQLSKISQFNSLEMEIFKFYVFFSQSTQCNMFESNLVSMYVSDVFHMRFQNCFLANVGSDS